jgi:hypothetical protein
MHAIDWAAAVKASTYAHASEISASVYLSGIFILLSILISYVSPIYAANQTLHRYQFWQFASQIAGFIGLLLAVLLKKSLFGFVLLCQGLPIAIFLINALIIGLKYPLLYFPSFKQFSIPHLKAIMALGLSFSVIGLTAVDPKNWTGT